MADLSYHAKLQFRIAGSFALLIVLLLLFFAFLIIWADNASYKQPYMPEALNTILDMIKVLVGAVVGALTPVATAAIAKQHDSNSPKPNKATTNGNEDDRESRGSST